ncbi:MAG: hypothetical protein ACTSX1_06455 [Candidatus Heimdallarchaeaceae archaeon]
MEEQILNIAGGKIPPLDIEKPYFIVNVDTMYYRNEDPAWVEEQWSAWRRSQSKTTQIMNVKSDVFEFMERTYMTFNRVCVYRFLEHVSFTNIMYFIYLLSTVTEKNDKVDVIVPNYKILAQMILDEDAYFEENNMAVFPEHDILLTTELLNEPSCPHASIWTPDRAYHFWEMEGRFRVENLDPNFKFDGRDIYLRFQARRR